MELISAHIPVLVAMYVKALSSHISKVFDADGRGAKFWHCGTVTLDSGGQILINLFQALGYSLLPLEITSKSVCLFWVMLLTDTWKKRVHMDNKSFV